MRYILTDGWEEGIADLTQALVDNLTSGKKVLWLVSGGSNIEASVKIMNNIPDDLGSNLSVTLIDERFGALGHADSNWAQLMAAGFDGKQANLLPVLADDLSFEATAARFEELIQSAYCSNDVIVAQIGIGGDGHVSGILPDSPAADVEDKLTTFYESQPYRRLTTTFPALRKINVAYAFAFGDGKKEPLSRLLNEDLPLRQQPAQILKEIEEAYVYNDQLGEPS